MIKGFHTFLRLLSSVIMIGSSGMCRLSVLILSCPQKVTRCINIKIVKY